MTGGMSGWLASLPVGLLLPIATGWGIKRSMCACMALAVSIEAAQLLTARSCRPPRWRRGDFRRFETELGLVLGNIRYSRDRGRLADYVRGEARFRGVGARSVELINALTDSRLEVPRGEERVDMCKAIEDMREDARNEGARETLVRNVRSMMKNLRISAEQALEALDVPQSERATYIAML